MATLTIATLLLMTSPVVSYRLDDEVVVQFEIDASGEWIDASAEQVIGTIRDAVSPAVGAARAVLDQVRQMAPDEVEVKFAIKVSGTANWIVAKAASEGNFEVTLTWRRGDPEQ